MSVNESQADESSVTNEQISAVEVESEPSVSRKKALDIQRLANARQSPSRDVEDAAVGPARSVEGSSELLANIFNDDGMAFDKYWDWDEERQKKVRALTVHPSDVEVSSVETETISAADEPEAYLNEVAPSVVAEVDDKFGGLPGSREQVLVSQAQKVADERGEECVEIEQESEEQGSGLVLTTHQTVSDDKFAHLDREEETQDGQECPECGSTNTGSYQQQVGSADESMTSFHNCAECGKTWRGGY